MKYSNYSGNFDFSQHGWMFEIVNNKRNSIDVDKLDYLSRDAQYLNMLEHDFDHYSMFQGAKVMNNQICYNLNLVKNIDELFSCRTNLFKEAYWHPKTSAIDLMICDIFFESNDYFKYDEVVQDMEEYIRLTDSICK